MSKMVTPTGPSAEEALIGQTLLGQYRIEGIVGRGGFGAVYLAEQLGVDRKAVIKVVHAALQDNTVFVQRFHREAKILAALDHHNLVKLYNFGTLESGQLFLAMEYGGDRTLSMEIKGLGRLDPERALKIAEQVCDALEEAHSHGIVHRDLKPANILLGSKGGEDWAKVVDVGIAKILDAGETDTTSNTLTGVGTVIGTPAYFSPEQARAMPVDARSDVYSMGIVLYEMLTGTLPIKAATPIDFVRAHAIEPPIPPRSLGLELPASVEAILFKALEKDPKSRFQSARAMKEAMARARERLSSMVEETKRHAAPRAERPPPSPQRGRTGLVLGTGAALAVAAAGALYFARGGEDVQALPPPPAPPPPSGALAAEPPAVADKLILRASGGSLREVVAGRERELVDSEVPIPAAEGALLLTQSEGWTLSIRYRRAGAALALTLESDPPAVAFVGEEPVGKLATVRVTRQPTRVLFKSPAGKQLALTCQFVPAGRAEAQAP